MQVEFEICETTGISSTRLSKKPIAKTHASSDLGEVPADNRPVDAHVHIVGTGAGGTGCWLKLRGWRRLFAGLLLRHVGLPATALKEDFDRLYVERLLEMVRTSSLASIVILAQDRTYEENGKPARSE